jgi:hypothetical protein
MPKIGPFFIPKSGVTATFQFFKYKLYRLSDESSRDWACRIYDTVSNLYDEGSWEITEEPFKYREFALYTWTCLVELAQEKHSQRRINEYKKAKILLARTCGKRAFLKPLAYGALLIEELSKRKSKFFKHWENWGDAYEELWGIGIDILKIYADEGRLVPFSEACGYTSNPFIKEMCDDNDWDDEDDDEDDDDWD